MNPSTQSKTALIIGASSGIGAEFAKLFAKGGYNLILVARGKAALKSLAENLTKTFGINVTILPFAMLSRKRKFL